MVRPLDFEDLLSRLQGVKGHGDGSATADCPVPGHATPQGHLSLRDAGNKTLVTCHGARGHGYQEICQALKLDSLSYEASDGEATKQRGPVPVSLGDAEAVALLKETYRLTDATIAHFGIRPNQGKQAWEYPVAGGVRYKRYARRQPNKYFHDPGTPNQLYGLDDVPDGAREVWLVNGEPASWVCYQAGVPATCGIYGEGQLPPDSAELLKNKGVRTVNVPPDRDHAGLQAAHKVSTLLQGLNVVVRPLPAELGDKADLCDLYNWVSGDDGRFRQALVGLPTEEQARKSPQPDSLTDLGNAERMVQRHGARLRYCYERKKWLRWTGRVWEWDEGAVIMDKAKETVRSIYQEAADEPNDHRRKALVDHARRSESEHRLTAMSTLAQSEPGIPVRMSELDRDPWLFNVANGAVDLRTGKLIDHDPNDLLTVLVPVEYRPEAKCPTWDRFLEKVMAGDHRLISYLQRLAGYSLTGSIREQIVLFLYGQGNNGKSTFVNTLRRVTGDYGHRMVTLLLLHKDKSSGGPSEGLANLKGKRFVLASELEDGRRLDVALVKDLTGGERIRADRKHEHEIEFDPTHKIWLVGNHKPEIPDSTLSIWRRVKLIPFMVTIPRDEVDQDLPAKLEAELPGILAWAVQGCLDWLREGLAEPEAVSKATAAYQREQDILADFLEDRCMLDPRVTVSKSEVKAAYAGWCADNGLEQVSQKTFKKRLMQRGVAEGKSGSVRFWKGIAVKGSLVPGGQVNVPVLDTEGQVGQDFPVIPYMREKQKKEPENRVPTCPNVPKRGPRSEEDLELPSVPEEPCDSCGADAWGYDERRRLVCAECGRLHQEERA